ncbi:hypothetical protein ASF43_28545 [Pseudorhodoferax sp. Leaf267]|nr:hypothetical protein ASF43_28545 [Pseudorhodoferax sp. Leaf267]
MAPLLLIALGWLVTLSRRWLGSVLVLLGLATLWLLSCNGTAIWLARELLPPVQALPPASAVAQLKQRDVQAIVVLGGGVSPYAPEYDGPLLTAYTASRVHYGAWLARESALPLGFAGGLGWSNAGTPDHPSEAQAVRAMLQRNGAGVPRWLDGSSRDTVENARNMAALLQPDGVQRIALVTSAFHMPRAVRAFEAVGLAVVPAPMGFVIPRQRAVLEWLPSTYGLEASHQVLREWLALQMRRY